ncbi:protein 5NUC-like isoform X5 [Diabrotica undecimpunctata]|uniref:protein 5NUC-like isoform X5 n=1 Tax=Diabrotica undecimpunctata TaxID=50387 RepID=UPI003B63CA3A
MKYAVLVLTFLHLLNTIFCNFDLVILHNNDIHGRFEQTERNSGTCQPKNRNSTCIGGFARTAHVVRKHREAAQNGTGPEVLYLYAGDTFIGTVWYTVHTWNISSTFMNLLSPDAQSLGNHEFDKGTKELGQYLSKLAFPTITCNLDLSLEPNIKPYVQKYVIVEKANRKIGIIGRLNLTFNDNGEVIAYSGQPILLENYLAEDEDILEQLEIYRPEVDKVNNLKAGALQVTLDGSTSSCRHEECNFGNLITDAFVLYMATQSAESWTNAPIGIANGGAIRTTITPGPMKSVSRGELLAALPFGNQVVTLKIKGKDLVKTLELGIRSEGETSFGEFLQVSGLRVVYDRSKPPMSRVVSVKLRCGKCDVPIYTDIDLSMNYTIILQDFLANGNDGHYILKENTYDRTNTDLGDVDITQWYIENYNPAFAEIQGRISFVTAGEVQLFISKKLLFIALCCLKFNIF